jgi:hypothetical protein
MAKAPVVGISARFHRAGTPITTRIAELKTALKSAVIRQGTDHPVGTNESFTYSEAVRCRSRRSLKRQRLELPALIDSPARCKDDGRPEFQTGDQSQSRRNSSREKLALEASSSARGLTAGISSCRPHTSPDE